MHCIGPWAGPCPMRRWCSGWGWSAPLSPWSRQAPAEFRSWNRLESCRSSVGRHRFRAARVGLAATCQAAGTGRTQTRPEGAEGTDTRIAAQPAPPAKLRKISSARRHPCKSLNHRGNFTICGLEDQQIKRTACPAGPLFSWFVRRYERGSPCLLTVIVAPGGVVIWMRCSSPRKV